MISFFSYKIILYFILFGKVTLIKTRVENIRVIKYNTTMQINYQHPIMVYHYSLIMTDVATLTDVFRRSQIFNI